MPDVHLGFKLNAVWFNVSKFLMTDDRLIDDRRTKTSQHVLCLVLNVVDEAASETD